MNSVIVTEKLQEIINLKAIPKETILAFFLPFYEAGDNLLSNFSVLGLIFALVLLFVLALVATIWCARNKLKLRNCLNWVKEKLLWNFVIKMMQSMYLSLCFASWRAVIHSDKALETWIGSLLLVSAVVVIVFNSLKMWRTPSYDLNSESTKSRIGTIYTGLKTKKQWSLQFSSIFYVRRFITGAGLAASSTFTLQTGLVQAGILLVAGYLLSEKPYASSLSNCLEIFNEVMLLLITYVQHLFTPYVDDKKVQNLCGWINNGLLALLISMNFLLPLCGVIYGYVSEKYRFYKLGQLKLQKIKERNEQIK